MKKTATKKVPAFKTLQPSQRMTEEDQAIAPTESEAQDRSEDLAELKDPFTQEPQGDAQVPKFNENLANRFDAERRSRPPF